LHVLHIDLGRELRGGQHQVLLLLKTLRGAGHSFTLLARVNSPLMECALARRFNVEPASMARLRQLSAEYDIVHAHDGHAHTWTAIASRRPFVVSRRVAFPVGSSPLSRLKYGRAARFLAVSHFVAGRLREAGVPETKIDVVYDSVEPAGSMQSWSADAPVIALASDDPKKGRDLIERASQMAGLPITFSSDLTKDFGGASAFVYISRSEGLGSAALLAMSMGVPVIASRIDGMAEVFEDGVSGVAVENDPAAIAAAIERVRANPELAARLIAGARRRVETVFNPSALLLKTLASYRRALAA
jgi:glycosyl transferase family 1/glycosyl transferase family 4